MSTIVEATYHLVAALHALGAKPDKAVIYLDDDDFERVAYSLDKFRLRTGGDLGTIKGRLVWLQVNGVMIRRRIWSRR